MSEFGFPLLGLLFVVLVVLPFFSGVARGLLWMLERGDLGGPVHRFDARYLLLTGPTLLPVTWLFSEAVHQAETGRSVVACLFDHGEPGTCLEPLLFAGLLAAGVGLAWIKALRRLRPAVASRSSRAEGLTTRLEALLTASPALQELQGHLGVTEEPGFAIGAEGFLRPRVVVGVEYAAGLSDSSLAGALGHEAEHLRRFDPLRYAVLQVALAANPFGRWLLMPHAALWLAEREIRCDREAVARGAGPIPLAEAIVRAARPLSPAVVGLGTSRVAVIRLRVELLLALAERVPTRRSIERGRSTGSPVALLLLGLALLLPHQIGTAALDTLHAGAEHTLAYFWN